MLGSPVLRALLAFLALAAVAWPLWWVTRPAGVPAPYVAPPIEERAKAIDLQLSFTAVPRKIAVRHLDREVWSEGNPAAEMERELTLDFPEKGVELIFQIEWPEGGPLAAMRVRLTDPTGETHEKSVWGRGTVEEVLSFP